MVKDTSSYSDSKIFILNYTDSYSQVGSAIDQDLIIDMQPFHGQPTVFINLDEKPADLSNADFIFPDQKGEELITITP